MTRALPVFLLFTSASAASVDILPSIYKDGVFRSSVKVAAADLPPNSSGVQLKPDSYGGEWFLTFIGPKTLANSVHLGYAGSETQFAANAPTVAKLTARLASTLATSCFNSAADRLPALRSWVEEKVRAGVGTDLNTERSFGPLRVQLLTNHADGDSDSPDGLAQLDMILSRSGTPGAAPWMSNCKK